MEKGNAVAAAGGAAAGAAVGTAAGGAMVDAGPASSSGSGANVNATKPRLPAEGTITNEDGSTTSVTRDGDTTTWTDRDENGKVTSTATETRTPEGTKEWTQTDGEGNTTSGKYGDYASSTNPDGSTVERWTDRDGNKVIDTWDGDRYTGREWSGADPESGGEWSQTYEYNEDGSGAQSWRSADGNSGSQSWDANRKWID